MDNVQSRVQNAITDMINKLDKDYLRKMQATMYRCSAKCCETPDYNMDDAQQCVEKCSQPLTVAQNAIGQELQSMQDRLQRCAMDCQDKIRDRVSSKSSDDDMMKYRKEMESCVVKCGDSHIELIPGMMKRIQEILKQQSK